jgi:hypothetical protein
MVALWNPEPMRAIGHLQTLSLTAIWRSTYYRNSYFDFHATSAPTAKIASQISNWLQSQECT